MTWSIQLAKRTASADGHVVEFRPIPDGGHVDQSCFRDPEGVLWRGRFATTSVYLRDEAQRLRTLCEAVDAYRRVACSGPDPFPPD